jgi:hypothetical protein
MSVGYGLECEEGEVDLGWGDCNDFNSNHTDGCMSSGCYSIEDIFMNQLVIYYKVRFLQILVN